MFCVAPLKARSSVRIKGGKEEIMEFVKKNLLPLITALAWFLGIVLGFCIKQTESVGGFFVLIAFVLTIVCIVKSKKRKPSPIVLPESISEDGKRYDLAYQYHNVDIVGRDYHTDVKLKRGEKLVILQEPSNPYDNEAVSVNVQKNGLTILAGYIGRDSNLKSTVNDYYNRGEKIIAFVDGNDTMTIGFYK